MSVHTRLQRAAALLAVLLGSGCATAPRYTIAVERTGSVAPGRYTLVMDHGPLTAQPEYPQALACVRTALARQGFSETADPAATDLQITFCYGAAFDRIEVTGWSGTEISDRTISDGKSVRQVQSVRRVNSAQREAHFDAWLLIASRTVTAGGYRAGWKVVARADATRVDADRIVPCLVLAAQPLLAPDAAEAASVGLNPGDPAVRALTAGRR